MKHNKRILLIAIFSIVTIITILTIYKLSTTYAMQNHGLQKITYKEIIKKKENKEDFILIISRSNCSHCATYKPKVQAIAEKNNIIVYYIDIDNISNEEDFLNEFNLENATPMTLFFIDGKETSILNRIEGDLSSKTIKETFKKMGFIR